MGKTLGLNKSGPRLEVVRLMRWSVILYSGYMTTPMQGTYKGAQMRDSRCFYSDPVHQLSQVRDTGLRGHNICLM